MPSIGHVAVGLAAGRAIRNNAPTKRQLLWTMVALSVVSLLPDADAVGFLFGVEYDAPWGHRGATHSIVFALFLGALVTLLGKRLGLPPLRLGVLATLTAMSHGLLDCLTNGGLGCALLWPFSDERFFAPVRPIPVAPLGHYMLSERGMLVVTVELIFFLPFFIYATFPRRKA